MVAIEAGKTKGSFWHVEGNLGSVLFSTGMVGGHRNLDVELNLTDLTKFVFPSDPDPRDFSNLGYWVEALTLVARLKDGSQDKY